MKKSYDGQNYTFAQIQFKKEYPFLNSILDSFQELIRENAAKDDLVTERWRPALATLDKSTDLESLYGNVQIGVNAFLTVSVAVSNSSSRSHGAWCTCRLASSYCR